MTEAETYLRGVGEFDCIGKNLLIYRHNKSEFHQRGMESFEEFCNRCFYAIA